MEDLGGGSWWRILVEDPGGGSWWWILVEDLGGGSWWRILVVVINLWNTSCAPPLVAAPSPRHPMQTQNNAEGAAHINLVFKRNWTKHEDLYLFTAKRNSSGVQPKEVGFPPVGDQLLMLRTGDWQWDETNSRSTNTNTNTNTNINIYTNTNG